MTLAGESVVNPLPQPGIDPAGNVTASLPCRQCGYDLHGLHESGRCPECGAVVGMSLRSDLLQFSQPEWVGSLRFGVKLILWSMLVTFVGSILAVILALAFHIHSSQPAFFIVILPGGIIGFVGSWQLTTPDPSGLGEDRYGTSRKLIRLGLSVGMSNYALTLIGMSITLPPAAALMVEWLSTGIELFALVASFALLNYLGKLALRIPDIKLSARANFLMYAMGGSQLVSLVLRRIVQRLLVPTMVGRGSQVFVLFGLFGALMGICTLVFTVMYIVLLLGFSKRLREAERSARIVWQASGV